MSSMLMLDATTLTATSRPRGVGAAISIIRTTSGRPPGAGRRVKPSARPVTAPRHPARRIGWGLTLGRAARPTVRARRVIFRWKYSPSTAP